MCSDSYCMKIKKATHLFKEYHTLAKKLDARDNESDRVPTVISGFIKRC